jgi:ribonuclease VapC
MNMSYYVLDASALIALLHAEPGSEKVARAVEEGAAISTVNLAEVAAKLNDLGTPEAVVQDAINVMQLTIYDFTVDLAYTVGRFRPLTKHVGLSLGDRACLALAHHLNLPALTTDRVWEGLPVDVVVHVLR